jgi:hypothetical protein
MPAKMKLMIVVTIEKISGRVIVIMRKCSMLEVAGFEPA